MDKSSELTQEELKKRLYYDPGTGVFTWISAFQSQLIGKVAGGNHLGYIRIKIVHKMYLAHRLAFLFMTGLWPEDQVDHINHIRSDNRWRNLRECTRTQNMRNQRTYKNNKSGFKGVTRHEINRKWQAGIKLADKQTYLGTFETKIEAAKAYNKAAIENFGEFALLNEI